MTCEATLINRVSAPIFALETGKNGTFQAWNRALTLATGILEVDAVGRTPVDLLGAKASGMGLAPSGAVQVPGLGLAVLERHNGMIIGTLQDHEREAYLGMAAHDLRAPLRNILFLAEEALRRQTDREALVAKIVEIAQNGMALTGDVVDCAQQLGFGDQPQTQVELAPLAESVLASLDPSGRHDLDCDVVVLSVEKPVVMAILRNLIDNAIRQGDAKRHFKISTASADVGISLRISDMGTGFKESALAFLSGGEFRAENGFGLLGLRRLVHSRGGRIGVEPGETGHDSAVVITLPGRFIGATEVAIAS